jgi:hypothetical protein
MTVVPWLIHPTLPSADLKAIGLWVYVQGGQLVVGPASGITPKLRNAIVADREALLAEVYREPQPK